MRLTDQPTGNTRQLYILKFAVPVLARPTCVTSTSRDRIRILFLIRHLAIGGAERQLSLLARGLDPDRFDVTVAAMYSGGGIWEALSGAPHVRLVSLDKRGRWDTAAFGRRLLALARDVRPHLVHGYMIPANELALLAGRAVGAKVAWGIRISDQDFSRYTRFRRTVHRLGTALSRFPDLLIANSHAGRASHVAEGYPANDFIVIPNAVDVRAFAPDADAGRRWRAAHGIALAERVVALPARLDPMKDHHTFLAAAAQLTSQLGEAAPRFVCAGDGDAAYGAELRAEAERCGLAERVTWMPAVRDVASLYNGADIVTSASAFGEGFPNVLGEAMACGTPCVAASSGDAAAVIGDAGIAVPPRDPAALAAGWARLLAHRADEREALGARARERIVREFTVDRLVDRSSRAFEAVVRGERAVGVAAE